MSSQKAKKNGVESKLSQLGGITRVQGLIIALGFNRIFFYIFNLIVTFSIATFFHMRSNTDFASKAFSFLSYFQLARIFMIVCFTIYMGTADGFLNVFSTQTKDN